MLSLNLTALFFILITISGFTVYADTAVYSVTFTGNGGTDANNSSVYIHETESYESLTMPAYDLFCREGYEFLYWLGSDGVMYLPGETYTVTEGISMTAQWGYAHITYTVQSPDGADILNTHIQYIDENGEEIKATDELIYEGYGFTGWNTEADGSGVYYPVGMVISQYTGRFTLYAQWTQCTDNYIVYCANGCDIFDGESYRYMQVDTFPATITLPNTVDNENCTYIGWTEDFHTPESMIYLPGEKISLNESTALNLVYTQNTRDYTYLQAIYNGNGGADKAGAKIKTTLASNGNLVLYDEDIFSRSDYDFVGWNTSADGSGTSYTPNQIITAETSEHIRLYAQWKKQTADVKGTVTSCFYNEGYATVNVRIDYIKEDCKAVMAIYNSSGRLCGIYNENIATSEKNICLSCPCDSDYADYTAKIFYWDINTVLMPLSKASETAISAMNIESAHPYDTNTDEGFIYSYPQECESISITFSESTETESGYDYIYIFDAENSQVGTYSGNELSGQTVTVAGNTVKIQLTSDNTVSNYGYSIDNITVNK